MKGKKQLEIYLQGLLTKERYNNYLEQYPTDSSTAAYILSLAYSDGNISDKRVIDLGTGNGVFACGSAALGASIVCGVDVDPDQISVAKKNCQSETVEFMVEDVKNISGIYDTALMNAPFGSVNVHADLPFLEKATSLANVVYSIHNRKSANFVRNYYSKIGTVFREENVDLTIGRLYDHHTRDRARIPGIFFSVDIGR